MNFWFRFHFHSLVCTLPVPFKRVCLCHFALTIQPIWAQSEFTHLAAANQIESHWIKFLALNLIVVFFHELPITTLVPCYLCFITFLPCDAMLARYMLWPCVCLSVTSRCSTKTDKRKIKQTTPHDSPGTLVFRRQGSPWNSTGNRGKALAVKVVVSEKWCDIDTLLLHTTSRKYHISYLFMPFPMTLDDLEGHLPNAGLIKFNLTNICATFSWFLTDTARRVVPRW